MSQNLIQNAWAQAKYEVLGNPEENLQFVTALVDEKLQCGHYVLLVQRNAAQVAKMLDRLVVAEESDK